MFRAKAWAFAVDCGETLERRAGLVTLSDKGKTQVPSATINSISTAAVDCTTLRLATEQHNAMVSDYCYVRKSGRSASRVAAPTDDGRTLMVASGLAATIMAALGMRSPFSLF